MSLPHCETEAIKAIQQVLAHHRNELLNVTGCQAVAIGGKSKKGEPTGELAITVFVEQKCPRHQVARPVPPQVGGVPTDVVERKFALRTINNDPHILQNPLFCGVAIAAYEVPSATGSLGCFIRTTGRASPDVAAGDYLLTNQHVVAYAAGLGDSRVIQPDWLESTPIPEDDVIGNYVAGFRDPRNDCAIVQVTTRSMENTVPTSSEGSGRVALTGIEAPAVSTAVFKFGAATRYTEGTVTNIDFSTPSASVVNALYIENPDRDVWVNGGDSGSVAVVAGSFRVMGLNFQADTETAVTRDDRIVGYYGGLAYPIQLQMNRFGETVTLTPPA